MCPNKRQLFSNVSLSRNTISEPVDQLFINYKEQLVKRSREFIAYSLAEDESTNANDVTQLSIFIHRVDPSLSMTGEFWALHPMHGTSTGQDLYQEVSRCVNEMGLPWEKLMGLTTDRAPFLGHRSGLVARFCEGMQDEKVSGDSLSLYNTQGVVL